MAECLRAVALHGRVNCKSRPTRAAYIYIDTRLQRHHTFMGCGRGFFFSKKKSSPKKNYNILSLFSSRRWTVGLELICLFHFPSWFFSPVILLFIYSVIISVGSILLWTREGKCSKMTAFCSPFRIIIIGVIRIIYLRKKEFICLYFQYSNYISFPVIEFYFLFIARLGIHVYPFKVKNYCVNIFIPIKQYYCLFCYNYQQWLQYLSSGISSSDI